MKPNSKCYNNHLGLWLIEPEWFGAAYAAVQDGTMPIVALDEEVSPQEEKLYNLVEGVAEIFVAGPMMKMRSKFGGGTSTVETRKAIRDALRDEEVQSIVMVFDSPGGHVAGTLELAQEVKAADKIKPVSAYIEDLGASAAYWVASQARQVVANPLAQVGSVGVLTVITDTSVAAESLGAKVHVVSTGKFKGMLQPGTPVTEEQLANVQERINDIFTFFKKDVKAARKLTSKQMETVSEGAVFLSSKAKDVGLIDSIQTRDNFMLTQVRRNRSLGRRPRAELASVEYDEIFSES